MSSKRKKQVVSLPKYTKEAGRAHTFHAKGERKSVISLHLFQFIVKWWKILVHSPCLPLRVCPSLRQLLSQR